MYFLSFVIVKPLGKQIFGKFSNTEVHFILVELAIIELLLRTILFPERTIVLAW